VLRRGGVVAGGRAPLRPCDHASVPFVDVDRLPVLEPRPGWRGQFFHSAHMTFAYYAIAAGADVHLHEHEEEEAWHVLDGELEVWLARRTDVVRAGQAFVVPAGEKHAIRALGPSRVIVVDHPVRTSVGGLDSQRGVVEGALDDGPSRATSGLRCARPRRRGRRRRGRRPASWAPAPAGCH
jgi:mannose-6-phosphate isomerase-like protein (cupin superfamily)